MANAWCAAQRLFVACLYSRASNEIDNGVARWCKRARLDAVDATDISNDMTDERSVWVDATSFNNRLNAREARPFLIDESGRAFIHVVRDANRFPKRTGAAIEQCDDFHGIHLQDLTKCFHDLWANRE